MKESEGLNAEERGGFSYNLLLALVGINIFLTLQAINIELNPDDLKRIEEIAPLGVAAGTRYPEAYMNTLNR